MQAQTSSLNILVVDDQRHILEISVRMLNGLGYSSVLTADDGEAALQMLADNRDAFDVLICDLHMPGMDGIQLLRRISSALYRGGVILLSGEDDRVLEGVRDLAVAFGLNVLGAIAKPLEAESLRRLLRAFEPSRSLRKSAPEAPIARADLESAVDNGWLMIVYQPQIETRTGDLVGVEALARLRHPQRGVLGPDVFIPLAEETGLIDRISDALFEAAILELKEWSAAGIDLNLSLNLAVDSIARPDFTERLLESVERAGVHPAMVTLEVTESQVMRNALDSIENLMRLRLRGFGLSIDDFGTGHSSLYKLKQVPFSELKIDRAFVQGAGRDAAARAILESSVDLARKLSMQVVAEGVETAEDWSLVRQLGCDLVQGYYCAKPMPGADLVDFARGWNGPR